MTSDRDPAPEASAASVLDLPRGEVTFSRVVASSTVALTTALDRRHTGYGVFTPSDALLLHDDTFAVIAFEDGIPTHARSPDSRGAGALAAAATPGPLRVALHDCPVPIIDDESRIAPDTPARRLAGDEALADRTLEAAPADGVLAVGGGIPDAGDDMRAVDAFLADEEAITRLKEQAREEAQRRAREWGFDQFTE